MSNSLFSEEMEKDYWDEALLTDAARMIDADLLEAAAAAQALDVDEEWLAAMQEKTARQIRRGSHTQRTLRTLKIIGKRAAAFVLLLSLLFSTLYFTVDAAREAFNNFMTGKTNRRATVVYPVLVEGEAYSLIPEGWRGPLYATWMPDGFMHATSGTLDDRHWWLCYSNKDNILDVVGIYAWDETYTPTIDTEGYELIEERLVQNVPAAIYYDPSLGRHMLIMVKNDLTIQVMGTISAAEIIQVAESIAF